MKPFPLSRVAAAAGAALIALAAPAQATLLDKSFAAQPFLDTSLAGTTAFARPELAGTVLADTVQAFSFAGLGISGTVQNRVVRETTSGTLDFYWRVQVDPSSTGGGISAFRLGDFGYAYLNDADWRIDGLGTVAPLVARLFNPSSHPEGDINFLFTDPAVGPGDPQTGEGGSRFFFLHTDATDYAMTATYDLLGGPAQTLSGGFATYAPAVPEPASVLLMTLGLAAVGWSVQRRARRPG